MRDWKPVDIIILIITLVVGAIITLSAIRPLFSDRALSPDAAKLVAGIIGSLVSIISIYVGSKLKEKRDGS